MKKLATFSSLIILTAAAACTNSTNEAKSAMAADPSAAKAEIAVANQQFEQAFAKGDSATIVTLYHADAKIFPPNMEPANRNMLGGMVTGVPKMGIKSIKLNTNEVSGGPDEVVETGSFEMSDSTKVIDKGSYLVVWKKDGDKWKMYRDIWNSSMKPAAGK